DRNTPRYFTAYMVICLDAENHIHLLPLLKDDWVVLQDVRTFSTKLEDNAKTGGPFSRVFLTIDPKSDPGIARSIVQLIREKIKYAQLTVMFGRRVLPKPENNEK